MSKYGPIVIIEDDLDDKEIFELIVKDLKLPNEIKWFPETDSALDFLNSTKTSVYLIFCDINLPGRNGLEFKKEIDSNPELRKKSIPFVFLSTSARQEDVNTAYTEMVVQGFFKKEHSYSKMKEILRNVFDYWQFCRHPNTDG